MHGREPVPLLEQVLAVLPETRMTIELKSAAAVAPTLAVVEAADAWGRVCVGGFDAALARRGPAAAGAGACARRWRSGTRWPCARGRGWTPCRRPLSALPSLPLAGDIAHVPVKAGPLRVVDAQLLRTAHAGGREVHVWTVDRPEQMRELLDLGVDGLLSDRPDLLREVLQARGQWPG